MTPYTQDTLIGIILLLGVGIAGSLLGILWYRKVGQGPVERGTIMFELPPSFADGIIRRLLS